MREVPDHEVKSGEMRPEVLVLLADDLDSQKMVATWPVVGNREFGTEREMFEAWSAASLVYYDDITFRAPTLFLNLILGPDGYVDPQAVAYIRSQLFPPPRTRKVTEREIEDGEA